MKGYIDIEKYEDLSAENRRLKFELENLKRLIYGAKSERFVPTQNTEQLSLFEQAQAAEEDTAAAKIKVASYEKNKPSKKKPVRLVIPAHLPREVEQIIEPDVDTTEMVKIGAEKTEELAYTPAKLVVKVTVRPKYVEKNKQQSEEEDQIHIAPAPVRFIPRCKAHISLLVLVIIDKFVDHLPLYRTASRLKRLGNVVIPSSTLSGWVGQSAQSLTILYDLLQKLVLASDYLMVDETRMEVLPNSPPAKEERKKRTNRRKNKPTKRRTKRGFMWGYVAPQDRYMFFDYDPSRDAQNPAHHLKHFKGDLQTDCYDAYDTIRKLYAHRLTHFHCLVHARRNFEAALSNDAARAQHALLVFQQLYALERQAKEQQWEVERIYQQRQKIARPILEQFFEWMEVEKTKVLPKEPIGKAILYMTSRKERMMHYLSDGKLQPDTNLIENTIRPIAVGRKNYLFAGSHQAAQWAAMFYSFFACCKMNDVNPAEWLLDVMKRLPNQSIQDLEELLPHKWNKGGGV